MRNKIFDKKGEFIIFKHSERCPVSRRAKEIVEKYKKLPDSLDVIEINVLTQEKLKFEIAEKYKIEHHSPQILVIKNQKCISNFSHYRIKLNKLK